MVLSDAASHFAGFFASSDVFENVKAVFFPLSAFCLFCVYLPSLVVGPFLVESASVADEMSHNKGSSGTKLAATMLSTAKRQSRVHMIMEALWTFSVVIVVMNAPCGCVCDLMSFVAAGYTLTLLLIQTNMLEYPGGDILMVWLAIVCRFFRCTNSIDIVRFVAFPVQVSDLDSGACCMYTRLQGHRARPCLCACVWQHGWACVCGDRLQHRNWI